MNRDRQHRCDVPKEVREGMVVLEKENPVLVPGLNAVRETLGRGRSGIREVWIAEGRRGPRIEEIFQAAMNLRIPVFFRKKEDFDRVLPSTPHQGVLAVTDSFTYADLDAVVQAGLEGLVLMVAADHITDEGNLGALIRTSAFFGAHALILPKDRSARVTPKVLKRSSGAYVHLPVVQVVNLSRTLDLLHRKGLWIIGAAGDGEAAIDEFDWNRDVVLVLGSEDRGLGHAVRKQCQQLVRIPGKGHVESLNVSVAGGVILSEIVRQRRLGEKKRAVSQRE